MLCLAFFFLRHLTKSFSTEYNEWVGWKNDTMGYGSSVEMTFEFDIVRNFTALYMHSNNDFRQGVQVSFFSLKSIDVNEQNIKYKSILIFLI